VAALDQVDELVDDGPGLGHALVVTLDREPVAPQADRAPKPAAERVEHAVADRGELGRDVVRDIQHLLHAPQCRPRASAHRGTFGSNSTQTRTNFPNRIAFGRRPGEPTLESRSVT